MLSITFIMIVLFIKSAVLKMSINQVSIQSKGHSHSQSYIFYMLDPVSIALDKGLRLVFRCSRVVRIYPCVKPKKKAWMELIQECCKW